MAKIRNSACAIVKNEAANLPCWFMHIKPLVDEIIIVDTGSTDDTKQLAQAQGARVYDFPWCDDFAAAKNFAIDKAQGDWIFFLDADEYFPFACQATLRNHLQKVAPEIDGIVCKMINVDAQNNNAQQDSFYQMRIFRNNGYLHYVGPVHEMLKKLDGSTPHFLRLPNDVYIYHTGYTAAMMPAKAKRNLALLQAEIAKNGEQPLYWYYLAECYSTLGDDAKVIYYDKKALAEHIQLIGAETKIHLSLFRAMVRAGYSDQEIVAVLDNAIVQFPQLDDFYILKGDYYLKQGKYCEAEKLFQKALVLAKRTVEKITSEVVTDSKYVIYLNLGIIADLRGDNAQAIDYFFKALLEKPYEPLLLNTLYGLLAKRPMANRRAILARLYPEQVTAGSLVANVLQNYPLDCLYYEYVLQPEPALAFLIRQDYGSLKTMLAAKLSEDYQALVKSAVELRNNGIDRSGQLKCLLPEHYRILLQEKLTE